MEADAQRQYQEELRKLKEVLDMGFILQEEFEFRKKELEEKYNISGSGQPQITQKPSRPTAPSSSPTSAARAWKQLRGSAAPSCLKLLWSYYHLDMDDLTLSYEDEKVYSGLVPADKPVPCDAQFYFELEILNEGPENVTRFNRIVALGFVEDANIKALMMPGWYMESFGYHGDDGKLFRGDKRPMNSGNRGCACNRLFGQGDVVGAGYDGESKVIFFTVNGSLVEHGFSEVPPVPVGYRPVIALKGNGTKIVANFGQKPFAYDLSAHYKNVQQVKWVGRQGQ